MTHKPHLVAIVGNDITFDTRVKKAAVSAANAGYKTTIVCYSPNGSKIEERFGNIAVIKVPVPFLARDKSKRLKIQLRPFQEIELEARYEGKTAYSAGVTRRLESNKKFHPKRSIGRHKATILSVLVQAKIQISQRILQIRKWLNRAFDILLKIGNRIRRKATLRAFTAFERNPFLDYEIAFGPIIEELRPDIIHAHDFQMIGVAVTAAQNLQLNGEDSKVIYDAHELIEGLSYPKKLIRSWMREERNYITQIDSVICISSPQAHRIKELHNLKSLPTVVLNCPSTEAECNPTKTIRDDLRVKGKILVYHGQVDPRRDLETLIHSLQFFSPDIHIAIVTNNRGAYINELETIVDGFSLEGHSLEKRLHFLPYVPAADLPHYLSTADAAVIPQPKTKNHQIAMPNKLFESIHAKLPILASDVGAVGNYVKENKIGSTYKSGSPEDLAKAGNLLLESAEKYKENISNTLLSQTTWEYQSKALLSAYEEVLGFSPNTDPATHAININIFDMPEFQNSRLKGLMIGPRNMAGQAFLMADAIQKNLRVPSISFGIEKAGFNFPIHLSISAKNWRDPFWQRQHREILSNGYSHILAESGTGVLGTMGGKFIDEQVSLLAESGISVAILLHGSEIRDPAVHRQFYYSPFHLKDDLTEKLEKAVGDLQKRLDGIKVPIYVTTPDLLQYIRGEWLPLVVDINFWNSIPTRPDDPIPTVLHMPTSGKLKGSKHIDTELLRLEKAGAIKYLRPETKVPAGLVPSLIAKSDIVVDGIVIGAYGVMSCQSMAAGRPVIANTNELGEIRSKCPVLHADPAILGSVLEDLLENRTKWDTITKDGREYVQKYHSGSYTAQKLQSFLNT